MNFFEISFIDRVRHTRVAESALRNQRVVSIRSDPKNDPWSAVMELFADSEGSGAK